LYCENGDSKLIESVVAYMLKDTAPLSPRPNINTLSVRKLSPESLECFNFRYLHYF
jgi:hypothetical protein